MGAAGKSALRNFARDRRGNFAIATGAVISVLAMGAGFAVNVAQLSLTRSNLLQALDSAVTSTARDLTTRTIGPDEARTMVAAFLDANGGTGFASADRIVLDEVVIDRSARTVAARASVEVNLAFPLFRASATQRVVVDSKALYSDKKIEVAMILDTTGSMAKTWKMDKIGDLQKAATNAVNTLMAGQDEDNPRVRMAIVPYAEAVNAGRMAENAVFVEAAGGSDLPPPIDAVISASGAARPDNCATERKDRDGHPDYSSDGPFTERRTRGGKTYLAKVNRDDRISIETLWNGRKVTECPSAEVLPLTADRRKLLDTIKDFKAAGYTAGGIAAQWGYYMLSPNWRSAIADAGLGSGPAAFEPRKTSKVAILMTDAQFNTAFAGVGPADRPQNAQGRKSRANAEAICRNMRDDGIEIFTIGFDLDDAAEGTQAKSVLKNCSTPDTGSARHYFEASTGAELDAAFQEIAKNIERLAIIK